MLPHLSSRPAQPSGRQPEQLRARFRGVEADASPAPALPGELTSSAGMLPQLQPLGFLKQKEEKVTTVMLHGLGLQTQHPVWAAPTLMIEAHGLVSIQWRKTNSTVSTLAWPLSAQEESIPAFHSACSPPLKNGTTIRGSYPGSRP